ncbi:hypothetical protein KIW84_057105 [Lathyrus oleraceus]|uniref:Uncharacterized protein n=1 Tax=Pisum sativum TaxID=3888 RepID=A0A9D4X041_PEA|nr:hypothetical protein KIW84_057105 [Pisum sativum]
MNSTNHVTHGDISFASPHNPVIHNVQAFALPHIPRVSSKALKAESDAFDKADTWELVDLQHNVKPIGCRWMLGGNFNFRKKVIN